MHPLTPLLTQALQAGIRLRADGEQLRVTAPEGALTPPLREALRTHKAELLSLLRDRAPQGEAPGESSGTDGGAAGPTPNPEGLHQPFPLTELQHAYWLGRDAHIEMGGTSSHVYFEFACRDLDVARLNQALVALIEHHAMLRAVVDPDGRQRILPRVPPYRIAVDDRSGPDAGDCEAALAATRETLSHQVLAPGRWPMFDIRVTLLPRQALHLHVSLDLILFDAASLALFFRDWHRLYRTPEAPLPPLGLSFRDHVMATLHGQAGPAYRRARDHWLARVPTLPPAPQLPLRTDPQARHAPRFSRRQRRLAPTGWARLQQAARARGLTPTAVLLALYGAVLARWSTSPHFTLNVTMSRRPSWHPDMARLLGNFTSSLLHEVDLRTPPPSLAAWARQLQRRLLEDLGQGDVCGVTVLREWARVHETPLQAAMPVVFSSGLASQRDDGGHVPAPADTGPDMAPFGPQVHGLSQTTQVWLDHHVAEDQGGLVYNWDVADAVFEDGVPDAMFDAYADALQRLAQDDAPWDAPPDIPLPTSMALLRAQANRTAHPLPVGPLHAGFVAQALRQPDAPAVLAPARVLRYDELLRESAFVADWLIARGLEAGGPVAVLMHKGWEQVVAVLGVLLAGGAYLPIDADLPVQRQRDLLRLGGCTLVLSQPQAWRLDALTARHDLLEVNGMQAAWGPAHERSLRTPPDQLAYLIFTSGSTGEPRGVMIDHRGAANTVRHVNRLFGVGPHDRVLAVSSLSFDLSVYDIFGLLDAGGALVLPEAQRGNDPAHWHELITRHGVTLWNSAPQLMRMLVDTAAAPGAALLAPLRTVLLSGDVIPPDLPAQVRQRHPDARVVSLGGATEASIWSVYHPVPEAPPPGSTRIPYGLPLPNQTMWVLDAALQPCPDHVTGRIFIGGDGLAMGYWQDAGRTAERFITHPRTGERLYDTGDLGRYGADGRILILGRADRQLKLRGHRIEPGEIEAVLLQSGRARQAAVRLVVAGPGHASSPSGPAGNAPCQLAAYIEPLPGDTQGAWDAPAAKAYLATRLPAWMVPQHVIVLDALPLSPNGKIDHRALPPPVIEVPAAQDLPADACQQRILDIWSRLLPGTAVGVHDNFFELGGDSLMATQLVRDLNAALPGFELAIHELFEHLTIAALAGLYRARVPETASPGTTQATQPWQQDQATRLRAEARRARDAVAALDLPSGPASAVMPRCILLTGATGWVGSHVLAALLQRTGARITCLLRPAADDPLARVLARLQAHGMAIEPGWCERIEVLPGDLTEPRLGLTQATWQRLVGEVDAIHHFGGPTHVLLDYESHHMVHVEPLLPLLQLATAHHLKPVVAASPMTVGVRRDARGGITVLHEERVQHDPQGLTSPYAQAKWVAEQWLDAAARRGVPVKIYRTAQALPSTRAGAAHPGDSHHAALAVALAAGLVPDWRDAAVHGVPVDVFAELLVDDALDGPAAEGPVHIENRDPVDLAALLDLLLEDDATAAPRVPLPEWLARCRSVAAAWPGQDGMGALAGVLFAERPGGSVVEQKFLRHPLDTGHFDRRGCAARLSNLTPPAYWRRVHRPASPA